MIRYIRVYYLRNPKVLEYIGVTNLMTPNNAILLTVKAGIVVSNTTLNNLKAQLPICVHDYNKISRFGHNKK